MIDGLKPYPLYTDSGVRWLGEVPAHWAIQRLRSVAEMRVSSIDKHTTDGEQPVRLCNYVDVYKNDRTDKIPLMKATALPEEVERYRLALGDVLITKDSETWTDIGVPSLVEYAAPDLVSCYHLALLRAHPAVLLGSFLLRALQARPITYQFHVLANGVTRYGLPHDAIKSLKLPIPPIEEQQAIVRLLDHADRRIGCYIRAKKKLVALLSEQKQAIIHRAVTRGLDSNVRLKATGNSWFPEIPNNWEALPMRRIIWRAVDGPHHSPQYFDRGIPFLSARNIKEDRWSLDDAKFISEEDYREFSKRIVPERGDVLYTKGGTTGVARAVDLDFAFQVWVHVAVLKLRRDKVLPHYLAMALNTPRCYEQSQLFTRGATNQDLGLSRMKDIVLPLPPLTGQETIVTSVIEMSKGVVHAMEGAQREIDLLREYRTRLIADAVTGKVDVRVAAADLPDEPTTSEDIGLLTDDVAEADAAELDDAEAEITA